MILAEDLLPNRQGCLQLFRGRPRFSLLIVDQTHDIKRAGHFSAALSVSKLLEVHCFTIHSNGQVKAIELAVDLPNVTQRHDDVRMSLLEDSLFEQDRSDGVGLGIVNLDHLKETVTELEIEHPRVTGIMNDLMVTLSAMGV